MIQTLVVDDEPLAQNLVAQYVQQTPFLELCGQCSNAKEAYDRISEGNVDLIFLDVQMPGMSGLTLMKSMPESSALRPKVIFTTAFSEYAIEGFKLDAVDYLLKPFDFDEFLKAAVKAQRQIELEQQAYSNANNASFSTDTNNEEDYFFVKSEYKLVRIDIPKIIYIEGLKDYIKIYLENESKPILTLQSLKAVERRLSSPDFIRIHRSFIININHVRGIDRAGVILSFNQTNTTIPIGDGYRATFMQLIESRTI
ncbi:MAG: LytTR family DNA-binding domain-containing protein [Bacteroidales bacterium]|nr:LytTR family DNA-binding domain-containing protein [Bacteroidales bacterium]